MEHLKIDKLYQDGSSCVDKLIPSTVSNSLACLCLKITTCEPPETTDMFNKQTTNSNNQFCLLTWMRIQMKGIFFQNLYNYSFRNGAQPTAPGLTLLFWHAPQWPHLTQPHLSVFSGRHLYSKMPRRVSVWTAFELRIP